MSVSTIAVLLLLPSFFSLFSMDWKPLTIVQKRIGYVQDMKESAQFLLWKVDFMIFILIALKSSLLILPFNIFMLHEAFGKVL
jgi:hypothetical protein